VPVTCKDVAQRADVSIMTVSRVFNPRSSKFIAPATRLRVEAAARELGYQPNRLASALITGRTNIVRVHVPEMSPYYAWVVRALQLQLAASGYELLILMKDPIPTVEHLVSRPSPALHLPQKLFADVLPINIATLIGRQVCVEIGQLAMFGPSRPLFGRYQDHDIDIGLRRRKAVRD